MPRFTRHQRHLLAEQLRDKGTSFTSVVEALIELNIDPCVDAEAYYVLEEKIKSWLEKNPNTDIVVLRRLLSLVLQSSTVARMYLAVMEFEGVIFRTGPGVSGQGAYSSTLRGPHVTLN